MQKARCHLYYFVGCLAGGGGFCEPAAGPGLQHAPDRGAGAAAPLDRGPVLRGGGRALRRAAALVSWRQFAFHQQLVSLLLMASRRTQYGSTRASMLHPSWLLISVAFESDFWALRSGAMHADVVIRIPLQSVRSAGTTSRRTTTSRTTGRHPRRRAARTAAAAPSGRAASSTASRTGTTAAHRRARRPQRARQGQRAGASRPSRSLRFPPHSCSPSVIWRFAAANGQAARRLCQLLA